MIGNYLVLAIAVLALIFVLVLVLTHERSNEIKEWLVGAAAGLDFAQIGHVHLFTIAVVFWLLTGGTLAGRGVSGVTVALVASAILLGLTSLIGPLTVNHTLALQLVGLAISAGIIGIKATPDTVVRMAKGLLAICLFSACWGILQKLGFLPIRQFNAVEGTGRVMGIYREPDWLGLFCSVGIIVTLRVELSRLWKIAFLSILGLALLFSLARASIVALAVVGVVAVALGWIREPKAVHRMQNRQVLAVFTGIIVIVLFLSPALATKIVSRFQTGFNSSAQDVGAQARTHQVQSLNLLARNAPWYGDGFSASGRVRVTGTIIYGTVPPSDSVSTNWVLGWWVDGKYLAIPLLAVFGLLALRCMRRLGGQLLLVVLVTSLVSDAVMLPITWFAVGLCLAELTLAESTSSSEVAHTLLPQRFVPAN
jgi:hypothetical protein